MFHEIFNSPKTHTQGPNPSRCAACVWLCINSDRMRQFGLKRCGSGCGRASGRQQKIVEVGLVQTWRPLMPHPFCLLRSECYAEEGGWGSGLQPARGDPSGRRAVLHQNVHQRAHHRDQLPHWWGVWRGDSGRTKVQGRAAWHTWTQLVDGRVNCDIHGNILCWKMNSSSQSHVLASWSGLCSWIRGSLRWDDVSFSLNLLRPWGEFLTSWSI